MDQAGNVTELEQYGERLADQEVWIEARKVKDRVIAIVQPVDQAQQE